MTRNWGRQRRRRVEGAPPTDTGFDEFVGRLEQARSHGDAAASEALIAEYVTFAKAVEAAVSPERRRSKGRPLEIVNGAQSKQFMLDLLPTIQAFVREYPRGQVLDVLDVGPLTGHGTNLLASLYATAEFGYRMRVTTLDISDAYRDYIHAMCWYVSFVHGDLKDHTHVYDLVIACHAIEHVPDPLQFCRLLQERSRGGVFFAPYAEPADQLTPGYLNVLDDDFLYQLEPISVELAQSPAGDRGRSRPMRCSSPNCPRAVRPRESGRSWLTTTN